jgi:uncharacterized protein with HEPN domain
MQLELKKHLADALLAAERIGSFTRDKDLAVYHNDDLLRSAVERQFLIIGEAMVRIRGVDLAVLERISESRRIIRFRNILVHGYDVVSHEVVWDVIRNDLPVLRAELEALLAT